MELKKITCASLALLAFCLFPARESLCETRKDGLDPRTKTPSAELVEVSGSVSVLPSGGPGWKDAESGMMLVTGDSLKTQKNSSAVIAFDPEKRNAVKVHPGSYVIVKLTKNEKIELIDGKVFTSLKNIPSGSDFKIRTPMATCGVRGTKFSVLSDKKIPLTRVSVLESSVVLQSIKEPDKFSPVGEKEAREICPWDKAVLRAKGFGAPSGLKAERISETEYINDFGAVQMIRNERAAVTDAYRNLAGRIYGVVIDRKTTLGDYAKGNKTVKAVVKGVVRGAKQRSKEYYSDGSVMVVLEAEGSRVKGRLLPVTGDIFGTDCLSGPVTVDSSEFEDSLL